VHDPFSQVPPDFVLDGAPYVIRIDRLKEARGTVDIGPFDPFNSSLRIWSWYSHLTDEDTRGIWDHKNWGE